jgi:hypothetical protein
MAKAHKCIAAAISLTVLAAAMIVSGAGKADQGDRVANLLKAINEIRTARDIKLSCAKYVDPYLGQSDVIKDYIEQFAAFGIRPKRAFNFPTNYIYFEISYPRLKDVPNSRFGRGDVVIISFVTDNDTNIARIRGCSAILKAAPNYL